MSEKKNGRKKADIETVYPVPRAYEEIQCACTYPSDLPEMTARRMLNRPHNMVKQSDSKPAHQITHLQIHAAMVICRCVSSASASLKTD